MDDNIIIDLFFARNEEALRLTGEAYGKRLFNLADNILRNDEDAEECVSSTYMKAWDSIPPQRPKYFFAYLAKICRNLAFDRLDRKKAAKRNAELVSLSEELEFCIPDNRSGEEMSMKELGSLLDSFLHTLSRENRMIFMRRYWFADSIAHIAARYGMSENAVSMRLNRSREKLRAFLTKEGINV